MKTANTEAVKKNTQANLPVALNCFMIGKISVSSGNILKGNANANKSTSSEAIIEIFSRVFAVIILNSPSFFLRKILTIPMIRKTRSRIVKARPM